MDREGVAEVMDTRDLARRGADARGAQQATQSLREAAGRVSNAAATRMTDQLRVASTTPSPAQVRLC